MTKDKFYRLCGSYREMIHALNKRLLNVYNDAVFLNARGEEKELDIPANRLEALQESMIVLSKQIHFVSQELAQTKTATETNLHTVSPTPSVVQSRAAIRFGNNEAPSPRLLGLAVISRDKQ